jgi:hypothetical protein
VAAPNALKLSPTGLSWDAVPGASGYQVTIGSAAPVLVTTNSFALGAADVGKNVSVAAMVGDVAGSAARAYNAAALPPVAFTASNGRNNSIQSGSITLTWANNPLNVNNVTGITLSWRLKGSTAWATASFPATSTGVTLVNLSRDKDYEISLVANGVLGNSAAITKMVLSAP